MMTQVRQLVLDNSKHSIKTRILVTGTAAVYRIHPQMHRGLSQGLLNMRKVALQMASPTFLLPEAGLEWNHHCLVVGHSLGGALATLAAYDIAQMGQKESLDLSLTCITFGAPRTGNHFFARDFNACVPECWNIINGESVGMQKTLRHLSHFRQDNFCIFMCE